MRVIGKNRAGDLSGEIRNRKHGDVVQRNFLRALDARKFFHADTKRHNGNGAECHGVPHTARRREMPFVIPKGGTEFS